MRSADTKKLISLYLVFSADVSRLIPAVKIHNNKIAITLYGNVSIDMVPIDSVEIKNNVNAARKCIRFDMMIESGITALGKDAFFMSDRSYTIEGVALDNESEKKFHTRSPIKRK